MQIELADFINLVLGLGFALGCGFGFAARVVWEAAWESKKDQ
jgi:hypothetical protein